MRAACSRRPVYTGFTVAQEATGASGTRPGHVHQPGAGGRAAPTAGPGVHRAPCPAPRPSLALSPSMPKQALEQDPPRLAPAPRAAFRRGPAARPPPTAPHAPSALLLLTPARPEQLPSAPRQGHLRVPPAAGPRHAHLCSAAEGPGPAWPMSPFSLLTLGCRSRFLWHPRLGTPPELGRPAAPTLSGLAPHPRRWWNGPAPSALLRPA